MSSKLKIQILMVVEVPEDKLFVTFADYQKLS